MKPGPILTLVCFLLLCYLFGSLLAYPLFELFNDPAEHPFHKLARHCSLIFGLLFSFCLVWYFNKTRQPVYGFDIGLSNFIKQLVAGLLIGCLILIVVEIILLSFSVHIWDETKSLSLSYVSHQLLKGLVVGLIVGFLEEVLFRGNIYKFLDIYYSAMIVIFLTSVVYAAVHFIKFPVIESVTTLQWFSGPTMLPGAMGSLFDLNILDTFITLFLLGVLLATVRMRYQSIAMCIGIHAGVVMMVKVSRRLTDFNPETDWSFLVNDTDRQMGIVASLILLISCLIVYKAGKRNFTDKTP